MALDLAQERQKAHAYLDHLPPEQLSAVRGLLETMLDPVSRALANAPLEDEEISAEEEHGAAEAREWLKHNKAIPHEDVWPSSASPQMTSREWATRRFRRNRTASS